VLTFDCCCQSSSCSHGLASGCRLDYKQIYCCSTEPAHRPSSTERLDLGCGSTSMSLKAAVPQSCWAGHGSAAAAHAASSYSSSLRQRECRKFLSTVHCNPDLRTHAHIGPATIHRGTKELCSTVHQPFGFPFIPWFKSCKGFIGLMKAVWLASHMPFANNLYPEAYTASKAHYNI
jgi:hypothetical protein